MYRYRANKIPKTEKQNLLWSLQTNGGRGEEKLNYYSDGKIAILNKIRACTILKIRMVCA